MYDKKNEANEFVGDSVADATQAAVRYFDMDAGDLRISQAAAGEIYGVGARTVIVAIPKNAKPPSGGGSDRGDRGGRGGSGGGRDRDRGRGRDRGDRGDRGGRDRGRGPRADAGGREEREERGERAERAEAAPAAPAAAAAVESKASFEGDVGAVGKFVGGVVERMKLGDVVVSDSSEDGMVVVQLKGAAADSMRGGDSRGIEAIQLLANQAAKKDDDDAPRVVVEVEGESSERESSLEELASRALKRALSTKRSIALDPMNGHDRRIIHLAIRDEEGVATMSIGTGRYRQVLIVPEGAAEYEEALSAAANG